MSASQTRKRGKILAARFADPEAAEVEAKARAAGVSVAGYLRESALERETPGTLQRTAPLPERQALVLLLGRLGKIGANLNQLAKLGNQGQPVPTLELSETLAAVRLAAERVRQALT